MVGTWPGPSAATTFAALAPVRKDCHSQGGRGLPEPGRARPGVRADAGFGGPPTRRRRYWAPPPAPKRTRWTTSSSRPARPVASPKRSTLIRRSLSWSAGVSAIRASTASVANCSTTPRKSPLAEATRCCTGSAVPPNWRRSVSWGGGGLRRSRGGGRGIGVGGAGGE